MKNLLTLTALIEFGTGLALVTLPSLLAILLFGSSLDTPTSIIIARVAGVALIVIGVACWLARNDAASNTAKGLVIAMIIYNLAIPILLVYAALGLQISGIGLWPVVLVHLAMLAWSIMRLLDK